MIEIEGLQYVGIINIAYIGGSLRWWMRLSTDEWTHRVKILVHEAKIQRAKLAHKILMDDNKRDGQQLESMHKNLTD
jgi:hypothetical protein